MSEPIVLRRWHLALAGLALVWTVGSSSVSALGGWTQSTAIQGEQIKELHEQMSSVEAKLDSEQVTVIELEKQQAAEVALLQNLKDNMRRRP